IFQKSNFWAKLKSRSTGRRPCREFASAMSLSAGLFLRQSQSLVMTPQLMQSIQLLQMTHLELNRFIAQEIEKNPLLELAAGDAAETADRSVPEDFSAREDAAAEAPAAGAGDQDGEWFGTQTEAGAAHLSE